MNEISSKTNEELSQLKDNNISNDNQDDDNNNDSSDDETEQQTKINFFDKFINKFKENLRKVIIILLLLFFRSLYEIEFGRTESNLAFIYF